MLTTITGDYPRTPNAPRPAKLRSAINNLDKGKITIDDLKKVENEVTIEVIREMESAGLDIMTDAQIRWDDAQTYIAGSLDGVEITGLIRYFDTNTYFRQPRVSGKLKWTKDITVDDFKFASRHTNGKLKAVLTGPYTLAKLSVDDYYKDIRKLTQAYADCLNAEMKALQKAGCPHIAINEPALVFLRGETDAFFESIPILLDGITATKALYTFFGAIEGFHKKLYSSSFDILGLDFVTNKRNWDFLPEFPNDKTLSFGIVDARNTRMEKEEDLHKAFADVARHVFPERLIVNPNCGLEFLPREDAWSKLVNMVKAVKSFDGGR